tara:strand:- start:311 stop:1333 length:1023 start_codon:yes stop_codon:yes gene_type:complete
VADILYTNTGYVASGYVQATFVGAASVSSSATISATGIRIRGSSANIFSNLSGLTWAEMGTWAEPKQATWGGQNFSVTADRLKGGRIVETSSFTVSATGSKTFGGTVDITGAFNTSINGDGILAGLLTSPPSTFTLTASAIAGILGGSELTSTFTQTTNGGFFVRSASVGKSSSFSINAVGKKINRVANFNLDGVASVQALGQRIRLGQSDITVSSNLVAEPTFNASGIALKSGIFTVDANAFRVRFASGAFTAEVIIPNVPGGFLADGEASIITSGSTLVVGSKVAFDPFRRVTVRPESRINIVDQETRLLVVPSESRKLTVQHTVLVDEVGPIDRRTG